MKTMTKDGEFVRVAENETPTFEANGWTHCAKSKWKAWKQGKTGQADGTQRISIQVS